jgi:hypothetical protein
MRRLIVVVAFVVAALLAAGVETASAGEGDRVVGGGRDPFDANLGFSAQSGPGGENPYGHINATLPFPGTPGDTFQVRLEVTCLAVVGNLAAAGAVVTESSSNDLPPGLSFVVVFRDTGLPGGEGDAVEPFFGAPDALCSAFLPFAAVAPPLLNGNVLINDAT